MRVRNLYFTVSTVLTVLKPLKRVRSTVDSDSPCRFFSKGVFKSNLSRIPMSRLNSRVDLCVDKELQDLFNLKDSKVSNWVVENKARALCARYSISEKNDKQYILRTLASKYAVRHENICSTAKKLVCTEVNNEKQMIAHERTLKDLLTPPYHWLFVTMGRLEHGVKFLVDLRTDVLELMTETKDANDVIVLQQLNLTLQNLLLLWFSVGFLHMERVTWQSPCDMLEKISNYEAIHPIKNWLDLKYRVGPYRRCYIFTHPSMPREPIVLLHVALCDTITDSVKGIEESDIRILGNSKERLTILEEDKSKIQAAIFYSISSNLTGLKGIELGNYLIKEAANAVATEFPVIDKFSSLSPIPGFREWLLERIKYDISHIFTMEECKNLQSVLNTENLILSLRKLFSTSLWTNNEKVAQVLKEPLLRTCAWYLYKEKRRSYALNNVANFHLRNGAVMWRINWLADPSPRGIGNSCGIMVNYRYFLNECEENSINYIEKYFINASESVIYLASQAERLRAKSKM